MQVMPATAKKPGFGIEPAKDDSPAEYNRVGRQLLAKLYDKYGDEKLAAAAYNWGSGNVDKWLASGKGIEALPKDLIDSLEVSGENLNEVGDKLHVSDLKAPEGVTILNEPEQTIAIVEAPRAVLAEEAAEEQAEGEATADAGKEAGEEE